MHTNKTTLNWQKDSLGLYLITPPTIHEDHRGQYVELWNKRLYDTFGVEFVEDDISVKRHNVLVGIHGDYKTWKLVSCLYGAFYLVVVDNRPNSAYYKRWVAYTLSDRNRLQILIPPGFGNAHLVLTDWTIFHYKQSRYYDRAGQFTLLWDDPDLGIWWPTMQPVLTRRDDGTTGI